MDSTTFTTALAGGVLIGLGAVLLMLALGRIAGISGVLGGLLRPEGRDDVAWRLAFLAGLVLGPAAAAAAGADVPAPHVTADLPTIVVGGLLVGFGTRLGGGCTSGHGVCGLARLSPRSLLATALFMGTAMLVVFVVRHVVGG